MKEKQSGNSLISIMALMVFLGAWLTHVVVCFKTASWGFLIAGALMFPVAIVHGIGIWFGAW